MTVTKFTGLDPIIEEAAKAALAAAEATGTNLIVAEFPAPYTALFTRLFLESCNYPEPPRLYDGFFPRGLEERCHHYLMPLIYQECDRSLNHIDELLNSIENQQTGTSQDRLFSLAFDVFGADYIQADFKERDIRKDYLAKLVRTVPQGHLIFTSNVAAAADLSRIHVKLVQYMKNKTLRIGYDIKMI